LVPFAIVASVIAIYRTIRRQRQQLAKTISPASIEQRLDELSNSMKDSARLVEQISAELDARAATAKQLDADAKAVEALAELHKDQADAVRRMLDAELGRSERRIRRDSVVIGAFSFIAGGGVSLLITLLVHPLQ
jgi:biopolymer transport protein ExbB/TolQ